jgi:outer membrane protein OmpA-like peptidoglycan-associated protein
MALAMAGVLILAGCSGMELQNAEKTTPQGTAYDRDLYAGYVKLSQDEFKEGDYEDSDVFAQRAMDAAGGKNVQPEMIASRNLPADKVGELTDARLRLMTALADGAAERKPLDSAKAQISFDCWMQEQEENLQPDDIAGCRDNFMMSLAAIEQMPKVAAAPEPAPMPEPMMAPGPFTVLFEFDKAELTPDARAMLADVVAAAKKSDTQMINVAGYTDLTGSDSYNEVLSEARANTVINFLVESGLSKEKIVGQGYGKADPVVAVEAPEKLNRRVEIKLQP